MSFRVGLSRAGRRVGGVEEKEEEEEGKRKSRLSELAS